MRLTGLLLLVFIIVPLIEIALFIEIGGAIGVLATIGLILLTAVVGVTLIRIQGILTLARIREKLHQDEIPASDLIEGLILLIAAVLLLTPGFFTDALGFLALIPALRWRLALRLLRHLAAHHRHGGHGRTTVIINGEVVEDEPATSRARVERARRENL